MVPKLTLRHIYIYDNYLYLFLSFFLSLSLSLLSLSLSISLYLSLSLSISLNLNLSLSLSLFFFFSLSLSLLFSSSLGRYDTRLFWLRVPPGGLHLNAINQIFAASSSLTVSATWWARSLWRTLPSNPVRRRLPPLAGTHPISSLLCTLSDTSWVHKAGGSGDPFTATRKDCGDRILRKLSTLLVNKSAILLTPNMTGRRFHRTMEMIPARPW